MDTDGAVDDNGYQAKIKKEFKSHKTDYTISGHIHKHQIIKKGRWSFCGNPYQKKFDETSVKGFLKCEARLKDGELVLRQKFIPSRPEFMLKTVKIQSVKDLKELDINSNIAYKLEPEEGVILPSDIGITHNVVAIKNKFKAPEVSLGSTNTNLRTGLKKFLDKCGLDDHQIKKAVREVKSAIEVNQLE